MIGPAAFVSQSSSAACVRSDGRAAPDRRRRAPRARPADGAIRPWPAGTARGTPRRAPGRSRARSSPGRSPGGTARRNRPARRRWRSPRRRSSAYGSRPRARGRRSAPAPSARPPGRPSAATPPASCRSASGAHPGADSRGSSRLPQFGPRAGPANVNPGNTALPLVGKSSRSAAGDAQPTMRSVRKLEGGRCGVSRERHQTGQPLRSKPPSMSDSAASADRSAIDCYARARPAGGQPHGRARHRPRPRTSGRRRSFARQYRKTISGTGGPTEAAEEHNSIGLTRAPRAIHRWPWPARVARHARASNPMPCAARRSPACGPRPRTRTNRGSRRSGRPA
jgi:hypothetical protein